MRKPRRYETSWLGTLLLLVVCCTGPAGTAADRADLVVLGNGDQLKGRVVNSQLGLTTFYAQLRLKVEDLIQIDTLPGDHRLLQVTFLNGGRCSGFLSESIVTLERSDGNQVEIPRERLERIVFARGELQSKPAGSTRWIRFRNGDTLSGRFSTESLTLGENGTKQVVALTNMARVSFATHDPSRIAVQLSDNSVWQGTLREPEPVFLLDLGPAIAFHPSIVAFVYAMGASGNQVSEFNHNAQIAEPPAGGPASTNLEGFIWIRPGHFTMGSSTDESGRDPDEGPQTHVVIPQGFWIAQHEVTQGEYQAVTGVNPSNTTGEPNRPVERVTWFDAMEYCNKLTELKEKSRRLPAGYAFRLPTEAEWEYACRAGTATRFSFGEDKNALSLVDYAWFSRNSDSVTHPVGTRRPNPWGLYDVHGNVWEWCLDRWEDGLPGGTITNKPVQAMGTLRVARGGSWLYEPKACRSANRDDYGPWDRCSDIGFRVVLAPAP